MSAASPNKPVTLITGDGIGPEVVWAARRVIEASGAAVAWEEAEVGAQALKRWGTVLPQEAIDSIKRNGVALKGPVGKGFRSVSVALRKALDLYANLRPVQSLKGIATRYPAVDIVVIRENTEGLYSGIEHQIVPGVMESLKIITEKASTRIARFAFEYARPHRRKKITTIHKANIMKLSDGLFLSSTAWRRARSEREALWNRRCMTWPRKR